MASFIMGVVGMVMHCCLGEGGNVVVEFVSSVRAAVLCCLLLQQG